MKSRKIWSLDIFMAPRCATGVNFNTCFFQVTAKVEGEVTNRGLQALDPGLLQEHPQVAEDRGPEDVDHRQREEELRIAPDQVPAVKKLLVEMPEGG